MGDYTNQEVLQPIVSCENAWSISDNYSETQNAGIEYAVTRETTLRLVPGNLNETESLFDQIFAKISTIISALNYKIKALTKKRAFDICFSLLVMILGAPVFLLILIITKLSSPGAVFYKQERMGRHGSKFFIYKFRSMHCNAECCGPQLSRADDPRITKWGRMIRRTRLDELPQFWNVLKGDMSVVGPRPERDFFVKKIVEIRPDYLALQQLHPGITSFGQVNYGYAENVEQMCDRLDHDLLYINKACLRADCVIIMKTVGVMVKGRGK